MKVRPGCLWRISVSSLCYMATKDYVESHIITTKHYLSNDKWTEKKNICVHLTSN